MNDTDTRKQILGGHDIHTQIVLTAVGIDYEVTEPMSLDDIEDRDLEMGALIAHGGVTMSAADAARYDRGAAAFNQQRKMRTKIKFAANGSCSIYDKWRFQLPLMIDSDDTAAVTAHVEAVCDWWATVDRDQPVGQLLAGCPRWEAQA